MFVVTPLVAAILLGSTFWTGVAATAVVNHGGFASGADVSVTTTDHQDACSARYHSYRMDNDSWLGRDGRWHVCTL
jgi:BA14K-like protein